MHRDKQAWLRKLYRERHTPNKTRETVKQMREAMDLPRKDWVTTFGEEGLDHIMSNFATACNLQQAAAVLTRPSVAPISIKEYWDRVDAKQAEDDSWKMRYKLKEGA